MMLKLRSVLTALALCASLCFATSVASAATIIKLMHEREDAREETNDG